MPLLCLVYPSIIRFEDYLVKGASFETGNRDDRIRTYGHSLPKRVLYQTELHPETVVPIAASPELPKETAAVEV